MTYSPLEMSSCENMSSYNAIFFFLTILPNPPEHCIIFIAEHISIVYNSDSRALRTDSSNIYETVQLEFVIYKTNKWIHYIKNALYPLEISFKNNYNHDVHHNTVSVMHYKAFSLKQ